MFRTLPDVREHTLTQRLLAVVFFTALTAFAAQVKFYVGDNPVPYTMQVFAVLMAGMTLGARDGMLSQILYIGLIFFNVPIAAGGMGAAALSGATAGYLIGFIPAAGVAGLVVEMGANRMWQRMLASVVGIIIIYAIGLPVLKLTLNVPWEKAWEWSVAPFIAFDLLKAVVASATNESSRAFILRMFNPGA